jgi:AraC-like DNA-binding protein
MSGGGPASQDPVLLRRLLRAKDRIDAASHEGWPIRRLARVSAVSEAHFARSFKQAFGVPPHRYLLTRRIERATALLRDTELPITEIAFQTGWESLGTFGRTFRDVTGENPGAVRSRARATAHEPAGPPWATEAPVPGLGRIPEGAARRYSSELGRVPACIVSAAHRPNLTTAVSEKRRREAAAINGCEEKEMP